MSDWRDEIDWRDEVEEGWPPSSNQPALSCRCFCVEERELEELIAAGADLEAIAAKTGATTGCSGCRGAIEAMLVEGSTRRGQQR